MKINIAYNTENLLSYNIMSYLKISKIESNIKLFPYHRTFSIYYIILNQYSFVHICYICDVYHTILKIETVSISYLNFKPRQYIFLFCTSSKSC